MGVSIRARSAAVAFFALLVAITRPAGTGGDTYWYAEQIKASLVHSWTASPQIWDFAHLAWRPIGKALAELFVPQIARFWGGDIHVGITFLLLCLNLAAALACGLILQQALIRLTGRVWLATLVTTAFWGLGPILSYSRSGAPYLSGLALTSVALYLASFRGATARYVAAVCGLLGGLAALLWIPYLLSLPAIVLAPAIRNRAEETWRQRFRFAAIVSLSAGILLAGGYITGILCRHISTVTEFRAWVSAESQYSRSHTLLRFPGGLVRSFYELGDESVWLKWYVFRDPYAQVGLADLLRTLGAPFVLFYASLGVLTLALWRSLPDRRVLWLAASLALPHFLLAIAYESGDPSRYVPLLTLIFVAFGYAIAASKSSPAVALCLALLCGAPALANLSRSIPFGPPAASRRAELLARAGTDHLFFVLNLRDDLFRAAYPALFQPSIPPLSIALLEESSTRNPLWESDFACLALAEWDAGRDIWVTRRILAAQPARAWKWVEADAAGSPWSSVHTSFLEYDRGKEFGGADGFFEIPKTVRNLAIVQRHLPPGGRAGCPTGPQLSNSQTSIQHLPAPARASAASIR